jgi:hypothetical protein
LKIFLCRSREKARRFMENPRGYREIQDGRCREIYGNYKERYKDVRGKCREIRGRSCCVSFIDATILGKILWKCRKVHGRSREMIRFGETFYRNAHFWHVDCSFGIYKSKLQNNLSMKTTKLASDEDVAYSLLKEKMYLVKFFEN